MEDNQIMLTSKPPSIIMSYESKDMQLLQFFPYFICPFYIYILILYRLFNDSFLFLYFRSASDRFQYSPHCASIPNDHYCTLNVEEVKKKAKRGTDSGPEKQVNFTFCVNFVQFVLCDITMPRLMSSCELCLVLACSPQCCLPQLIVTQSSLILFSILTQTEARL